ncbi:hypothetical protein CCACVL1_12353 [Corchorus capsularis]|uniref:Uncharacterized protein n=1 Tax=Corchorus capsularis TaxID=210143 RepID=A0A1R3IG48_COCAP|nr:hypothetical protein CCACVL1_12353 [Corchorus capsularis]
MRGKNMKQWEQRSEHGQWAMGNGQLAIGNWLSEKERSGLLVTEV